MVFRWLARLGRGWLAQRAEVGWLSGPSRMAPTSSFSQFFASSEPPPPTNAFDSMRARVGSAITPAAQNAQAMQATVLPEKNPLCPNMSFKDRVRGCIGCTCIGIFLSFLGFMAWWGGHIGTFAVIYTLGNLVALCSTGFLIGPKRQFKQMFQAKRAQATAAYIVMMFATVICAFAGGPKILVLIFIFMQWCALIWYIASYVPYGRKMLSKIMTKAGSSAMNM